MPLDTTYRPRRASGPTAQEQLLHRQAVAAGSSPFHRDEKLSRPDTSRTVSCTCCSPSARFVTTAGKTAEEWRELHRERESLPKPPKLPESGAAAVALIRATVNDRISNGELKPGQTLKQGELADELRVYPRWMSSAVGQLVTEGVLGYIGTGSARRAVVV